MAMHSSGISLAACSGKRNVTVWRPSVCPSVSLSHRHTHPVVGGYFEANVNVGAKTRGYVRSRFTEINLHYLWSNYYRTTIRVVYEKCGQLGGKPKFSSMTPHAFRRNANVILAVTHQKQHATRPAYISAIHVPVKYDSI